MMKIRKANAAIKKKEKKSGNSCKVFAVRVVFELSRKSHGPIVLTFDYLLRTRWNN